MVEADYGRPLKSFEAKGIGTKYQNMDSQLPRTT